MQVGEPISVAPPSSTPDDVEFAAELVSVNFKGSLKTSHAKAEITGPHWEKGKEGEVVDDWKDMAKKLGLPPEPYSKRAAVFLVKGSAGGAYDVEVKVKVTKSKNVSGDAKLLGNFNGLVIEGKCPTGAGEHVVAAKLTEPPEDIQAFRGRIGWGLEVPSYGGSVSLGTTLAEVYFILGLPTTQYKKGVWVEVLRFLCGKVGVTGLKEPSAANAKVTRYCHGSHGLRYDTDDGAPQYGTSPRGGTFQLTGYMERRRDICNCYDQASAIQVLVGALGIRVAWLYLDPFGYIKATTLVGVGRCNSPFFGNDERKKLVAWNDPGRTGFGNHAFAGTAAGTTNGKILDACGGPHTGTETASEYVAASIDSTPALYVGWAPGTAAQIVVLPDIANVA